MHVHLFNRSLVVRAASLISYCLLCGFSDYNFSFYYILHFYRSYWNPLLYHFYAYVQFASVFSNVHHFMTHKYIRVLAYPVCQSFRDPFNRSTFLKPFVMSSFLHNWFFSKVPSRKPTLTTIRIPNTRLSTPVLEKSTKLPSPCKTCGRPDQPERFHSHPATPMKSSPRNERGTEKSVKIPGKFMSLLRVLNYK